MKIVTDNAIDISPEYLNGLDITIVPLSITLDGKSYKGGVDLQSDEFYKLVRSSSDFPTTSQPSPGDFAEVYNRLAETDKNILSIHLSADLSGTYNSARLGADLAKESGANITVINSRSVSGGEAWMVMAAAKAAKAGWSVDQIKALIEKIGSSTYLYFSPDTLKYLVHGGRASHLQGFAASMLNIKPLLSIGYQTGKVENLGRARTMKKAIAEHIKLIEKACGEGAALRVQIEHGDAPDTAEMAREMMNDAFKCDFMPTVSMTPVIGSHGGPGIIGIVFAPLEVFNDVP